MAARTPKTPRLDRLGDALPKHAIQRLGTERMRTLEEIRSVGLSADGSVVAASTGRDVHLWKAATGELLRVLTLPKSKSSSSIDWISFSGDGALVYVVAESFFALDAVTGRVASTIAGCNSSVSVVDDRWVAAAWGMTTKVFDFNGKELAALDANADVLAFSPDTSQLAVLVSPRDAAQQVRIFDTKKWKPMCTWDGPLAPKGSLGQSALSYRRTSRFLNILWADGSQQEIAPKIEKLYNSIPAEPPGKVRSLFEYHPKTSVLLTPDGVAIISVQYERFDARSGSTVSTLAEPLHGGSIALSADGLTVAAAEKYAVRLFEVDAVEERQIVDTHTQQLAGVAFSPGGDAVITFDAGAHSRAWDVETGAPLPLEHSAKLPPKTRSLLVMKPRDEETRLVDVLDAKAGFKMGKRAWAAAAFADDNSVVAFAIDDQTKKDREQLIEVWSIPARKKIVEIDAAVRTLALSSDGTLLAACAWQIDDLRIWKLPSGKKLRFFKSKEGRDSGTALYDRLELSPDGTLLVGANGRFVVAWSVATGKRVAEWKLRNDVRALGFTPDSAVLAAGNENGCWLWAPPSGDELAKIPSPAFDLRFSNDGARLVTAGRGSALVWDVAALIGRRKRT